MGVREREQDGSLHKFRWFFIHQKDVVARGPHQFWMWFLWTDFKSHWGVFSPCLRVDHLWFSWQCSITCVLYITGLNAQFQFLCWDTIFLGSCSRYNSNATDHQTPVWPVCDPEVTRTYRRRWTSRMFTEVDMDLARSRLLQCRVVAPVAFQ